MNETLAEMIQRHEGVRRIPYLDSLGIFTVGYGHNMQRPLSQAVIDQIFSEDLQEAINECVHAFPWFADLTDARKNAMVDLCFNLGLTRLLKFQHFLTAMAAGQYETAANELLDSLWARQVKHRALELATLIRGTEEV